MLPLKALGEGSFLSFPASIRCWQSVECLGLQLSPSNPCLSLHMASLHVCVSGSKFPLLLRMSVIWGLGPTLNHYDLISIWSYFQIGLIHRLQVGILYWESQHRWDVGMDVTRGSRCVDGMVSSPPSASQGGPLCPTTFPTFSFPCSPHPSPFFPPSSETLPGGPGVKTLRCQCREHRFKPWSGN